MRVIIKHKGDFEKTMRFLTKKRNVKDILDHYGKLGVDALASSTPVNTGLTSKSWAYEYGISKTGYFISWTNSNVVKGVPIAIILQYGHGTRNGGYVQGKDYINPAIQPIMDNIAEKVWKEVTDSE